MTSLTYVDWRQPRKQLEPFLSVRGGIVHIRTSSGCASEVFLRTIQHVWLGEFPQHRWAVCVVDAANLQSHYPADVVREIARVTQINLPSIQIPGSTITVASNIEAGNNVTLSNITVAGNEQYEQERHRVEMEALRAALPGFLKSRRLVLIFCDTHDLSALDCKRLARNIWDGRLSEFLQHGLLVFFTHDTSTKHHDGFPPPPDLIIDLPAYVSTEADRMAAIEDIAAAAMHEGWTNDLVHAMGIGSGIVDGAQDMASIHALIATNRARRRATS